MYDRFISPVKFSLPGSGSSETALTGRSAPEALSTFSPKLVMPMMLKNPPGQSPSFCVSRFSVYSARPPYFATSSVPPVITPWGICVTSTSRTTPLCPRSSRRPNQIPVSRGRSQKLPPHVGGISTGCANVVLTAETRTRQRTSVERTGIGRRLTYPFMRSPSLGLRLDRAPNSLEGAYSRMKRPGPAARHPSPSSGQTANVSLAATGDDRVPRSWRGHDPVVDAIRAIGRLEPRVAAEVVRQPLDGRRDTPCRQRGIDSAHHEREIGRAHV